MTRYFVYRDPGGYWSVSRLIDGDNWEFVTSRPTWRLAVARAFNLAEKDGFSPLPARMVIAR